MEFSQLITDLCASALVAYAMVTFWVAMQLLPKGELSDDGPYYTYTYKVPGCIYLTANPVVIVMAGFISYCLVWKYQQGWDLAGFSTLLMVSLLVIRDSMLLFLILVLNGINWWLIPFVTSDAYWREIAIECVDSFASMAILMAMCYSLWVRVGRNALFLRREITQFLSLTCKIAAVPAAILCMRYLLQI